MSRRVRRFSLVTRVLHFSRCSSGRSFGQVSGDETLRLNLCVVCSRELVRVKEEQERLRHRQRQENSSPDRRSHRRRKELEEKVATRIQASFRGFRSRQEIREQQRK